VSKSHFLKNSISYKNNHIQTPHNSLSIPVVSNKLYLYMVSNEQQLQQGLNTNYIFGVS